MRSRHTRGSPAAVSSTYFPTKEDLVVGSLAERGQDILLALQGRQEIEPLWALHGLWS